jgi:hypothetical protein
MRYKMQLPRHNTYEHIFNSLIRRISNKLKAHWSWVAFRIQGNVCINVSLGLDTSVFRVGFFLCAFGSLHKPNPASTIQLNPKLPLKLKWKAFRIPTRVEVNLWGWWECETETERPKREERERHLHYITFRPRFSPSHSLSCLSLQREREREKVGVQGSSSLEFE